MDILVKGIQNMVKGTKPAPIQEGFLQQFCQVTGSMATVPGDTRESETRAQLIRDRAKATNFTDGLPGNDAIGGIKNF